MSNSARQMSAQTTKQGIVCSVQEDRTAPPRRYRPLWEILKVSDDKVTHHFYQKGVFGLNCEAIEVIESPPGALPRMEKRRLPTNR